MKSFPGRQRGFAMPAMFIAMAVAFLGSLNVKTDDGTPLAARMGFVPAEQTDFAAIEHGKMQEPPAND